MLPGDEQPCGKCQVIRVLLGRLNELDKDQDASEDEKVADLTILARELGFHFADVFNHLEGLEGVDEERYNAQDLRDAFLSRQASVGSFIPASDLDGDVLLAKIREFGVKHTPLSMENFRTNKEDMKSKARPSRRSIIRQTASMPWETVGDAGRYVKELSPDMVLSTWGILYCGGSPAVEKMLHDILDEYGISLDAETFDW